MVFVNDVTQSGGQACGRLESGIGRDNMKRRSFLYRRLAGEFQKADDCQTDRRKPVASHIRFYHLA